MRHFLARLARPAALAAAGLLVGCLPSAFDEIGGRDQSEGRAAACDAGAPGCAQAATDAARDEPADASAADAAAPVPPASSDAGAVVVDAGARGAPAPDASTTAPPTTDAGTTPPVQTPTPPPDPAPSPPPSQSPGAGGSAPLTNAPRSLWPGFTVVEEDDRLGDVFVQFCHKNQFSQTTVCRTHRGERIDASTVEECRGDVAYVCAETTLPVLLCDMPSDRCVLVPYP